MRSYQQPQRCVHYRLFGARPSATHGLLHQLIIDFDIRAHGNLTCLRVSQPVIHNAAFESHRVGAGSHSLYELAVNRLGQKLRDKRGMRGKSPGNTAR
jgi:hypothetical protein